jgi:ABC-type polysaccharide/polyol phosphate transport system ATPase subunit
VPMDTIIKANHISKKFELDLDRRAVPDREFHSNLNTDGWALRDISFEVKAGEVLGLCGRNGTGKSTLLKIMSGIMKPTSGSIMMKGRVGSMLELGAGFAQELSGRENIMMTGALLSMPKKNIQRRVNDIIEFSGLGNYIDTPVKHYSSGMYMRLAFTTLTLLDTDILLFDEVMNVGDAEFRIKSSETILQLVKSGRTIIMTSHNMQELQSLCTRVIWMDDGYVKFDGNPHDVAQEYMLDTIEQLDAPVTEMQPEQPAVEPVAEGTAAESEPVIAEKPETRYSMHHKWMVEEAPGNEHLRLLELTVHAVGKRIEDKIFMQDPIEVNVSFMKAGPCRNLELLVLVNAATGEQILVDSPAFRYEVSDYLMPEGIYNLTCTIPAPLLNRGVYFISLAAICSDLSLPELHKTEERVWQQDRLVGFKVHVREAIPSHPRFAVVNYYEQHVYSTIRPYLKWEMKNQQGNIVF